MTESKDFTFAIFLKSYYEVRPKKHPTQTKSHHWKLRIGPFNPRTNIRRVEFILHETFEEPIQIKKEPPFEIKEDGFGNFQMHINVKILNRIIPIPYNIVLTNERSENVQIHYSIWSVKPKELRKVLDIGGIPIDDYNNESEQCRALNRISDILSKHEGHSIDNTKFYPKAFERVQKVLLDMDLLNERDRAPSEESTLSRHTATSIPPVVHHKTQQSEHTSKHRNQHSKDMDKSPRYNMTNNLLKSAVTGKESKKDGKPKKRPRDSSSESDFTEFTNNTGHSNVKKSKKDILVKKEPKLDSQKPVYEQAKNSQIDVPQKPILSSTTGNFLANTDSTTKIKLSSTDKLLMKSKSEKPSGLLVNNSNSIISKPKVKSKEHLNNPPPSDSFSKIFDAPDTIVLNKGKANLAKDKKKSSSKLPKHNPLIKKSKNLSIVMDENIGGSGHKKSLNSSAGGFHKKDEDIIKSISESPGKIIKSKMTMPSKKIPDQSQSSKSKLSKSEIELQSKLFDDSDESNDEITNNHNNINNNNNSDFSSSDDELDPTILGPKKGGAKKKTPTESPIDPTKVGVKQLFGDDDDDDDDEEGEDETGVENDGGDRRNPADYNGVTNETNGDTSVNKSAKNEKIESNNNTTNGSINATVHPQYTYDDRQKLAQKLAKLHNEEFYDKFQRLMLVMYQNEENSVRLDEEMMMHFDLELLSDQYVDIIMSMVNEYSGKNENVIIPQNNQHQHHRHDKHRRRQRSNNYSNNNNNCEDVHK